MQALKQRSETGNCAGRIVRKIIDSSGEPCENRPSLEDEPVTLCMAAECEYRDRSAILFCADWRAQTGDINSPEIMIGADDVPKMRTFLGANVMLAGNQARAIEMATACKPSIRAFVDSHFDPLDTDIAVNDFMKAIRKAMADLKQEIIHTFVLRSAGIEYSDFIKLSTDETSNIWHSIRQLTLGADLLIGIVKAEPVIIRVDKWGDAHWENNYGVIGSGAEVARALLCLQPWSASANHREVQPERRRVPLEECLFRLQEAHFVAHKANPSSVGEIISLQVLTANHRASIRAEILKSVMRFCRDKHKVMPIDRSPNKNAVLCRFESMQSGEMIGNDEPDEL
jgi:hypothetical protein